VAVGAAAGAVAVAGAEKGVDSGISGSSVKGRISSKKLSSAQDVEAWYSDTDAEADWCSK